MDEKLKLKIMENSQPLLDDLAKKDEDMRVIESGVMGTVIETTLDIGYDLTPEEPEEIVIETLSIPVRIVRHVFVINVGIAFLYALFGLVPYTLLLEVPKVVPYTLLGVSSLMCVVCLLLMHIFREKKAAGTALLSMWICITFLVMCSLAASLDSFAPFQACTIFFIQGIVGLIYCLFAGKDRVNPWWAALIMMVAGLVIWAIGLYSFIREQDWITSGLLFFVCVLLSPLYSALQIHMIMTRYNMEELLKANIEFFTGVIMYPMEWCKK